MAWLAIFAPFFGRGKNGDCQTLSRTTFCVVEWNKEVIDIKVRLK